jgi:hypothetical protein
MHARIGKVRDDAEAYEKKRMRKTCRSCLSCCSISSVQLSIQAAIRFDEAPRFRVCVRGV